MKAALLAALVFTALGSAAEAAARKAPDHRTTMAPLERSATACFAETVLANPAAVTHARAGRWYEAAGVIGFLCRPEVDALIRTHDKLYGQGTGSRYFKGAYAKHLGHELELRLQPMLERKAVASAEPGVEKARAGEASDDLDSPETVGAITSGTR